MRPSSRFAILVILAICAQSRNAVSQENVLFTKNLGDGRKIEVSRHEIPVPPPAPITAEEREWEKKGWHFQLASGGCLNSFNIVSPDGRQTNSIWSRKTYVFPEGPWGASFHVMDAAATSNEFIVVYRDGRIFANVITTTRSGEHVSMPAERTQLLSVGRWPADEIPITSARIEGTLRDKNLTVMLFQGDTEVGRFRLTETETGKRWVAGPHILFSKSLADGRKIEVSSHEVPVGSTTTTAEEREWAQMYGGTFYHADREFLNSFNIVSPDGRQTNSIWSTKSYVFREGEGPYSCSGVIDAAATSNEFIAVYEEHGGIFANVITTTRSGEHVSLPAERAKLLSAEHLPIASARIEGTLRDKNLAVVIFWEAAETHRFHLTETATGKLWVEVPSISSKGSGD